MTTFSNAGPLMEKWKPVLNAQEAGKIADPYRRATTAILLENNERALKEEVLLEGPHTNATGAGISNWSPILISLVRRAMPNLMAYDIASVQPMTGPTGLVFAMRSRYSTQAGTEALFNEADTDFSGVGIHSGSSDSTVSAGNSNDEGTTRTSLDGAGTNDDVDDAFSFGRGMTTAQGEAIGSGVSGDLTLQEMGFSIEQATVTAKTRALKAEFTTEMAQDLKAVHGLDAEAELANILSAEILAEINREVLRTINWVAKKGAATSNVATAGDFNVETDSDGRWFVEKVRGLHLQLEFECNQIAKETRRGKGNFIICSSNVASALASAQILGYDSKDMKVAGLDVDDTGNTYAGTIAGGQIKVYIDPYATRDYITAGYRGKNPYDAGMFYCPYVPLTMVRAVNPNTFQPKIGFKTRYGLITNPFSEGTTAAQSGIGNERRNVYFRNFRVSKLLG